MNLDFEILAPAGSFEILKAVIDAGADAVYLAGNQFGARAYANNFSEEELLLAMDYAHLRGKKIYLTVNTLVKNAELLGLYDFLRPLVESGLDAVLVQDFGVLSTIHSWFPQLPIHTSTQMTVTGALGVSFLKQYGVTRVVMAREMSIEEMKQIHEETGMELEAFVHGALCYSFSGQCLFSSMLGGRSGNRGRCAQPCRLSYQVQDEEYRQILDDSYVLSLKDLCGIEQLQQLKEAGVYSLKIEGRMKQHPYAAAVVSMYRKYVDSMKEITKEDKKQLLDIGNRCGFTDCYYHKHNDKSMVTFVKPSFSSNVNDIRLEQSYVPLIGNAEFMLHQPAKLTVTCPLHNKTVSVTGMEVMEAQKRPVSKEELMERLQKTKDTAFGFEKLNVLCDDAIFLPNGAINQLKRDAIALLEKEILKDYKRSCENASANVLEGNAYGKAIDASYIAAVETMEQLKAVLEQDLFDTVFLDSCMYDKNHFLEQLQADIKRIEETNKKVFLMLPHLFRKETSSFYISIVEKLRLTKLSGVVVRSYEELMYAKEYLSGLSIVTDANLYTYNDASVEAFGKNGVSMNTMPLELNRNEIRHRNNAFSNMLLYGNYPLMVSAGCVCKNTRGCTKEKTTLHLIDRYHMDFPVKNYCNECYNIIYNSLPTMLFAKEEELRSYGVTCFRFSFTTETYEQVKDVISLYQNGNQEGKTISFTGGHYKRGVE